MTTATGDIPPLLFSEPNHRKTPDEWCRKFEIKMVKPVGWQGFSGRSYQDPIPLPEFWMRVGPSEVVADWPRVTRMGMEEMAR